jgi:uncharacterized protein
MDGVRAVAEPFLRWLPVRFSLDRIAASRCLPAGFKRGIFKLLLRWFGVHPQPGFNQEDAAACFGLQSMPPLPLFLLNATGFALLLIGTSTLIARRWHDRWGVRTLSATGLLALTWYVAHIVLGLGGVIVLGWTRASQRRALITALVFFSAAVVVSLRWNRRFSNGPLEFILRRVGQWQDFPK